MKVTIIIILCRAISSLFPIQNERRMESGVLQELHYRNLRNNSWVVFKGQYNPRKIKCLLKYIIFFFITLD